MNILIQLFFWAVCIGSARYQAYRFDVLQKTITHWRWATAYVLLCCAAWWLTGNLILASAVLCLRLPLFTTLLNFWRIPRRPLFYTGWEANGGSKFDEFWKDAYPAVFFLTCIAYVVLQFYIYG